MKHLRRYPEWLLELTAVWRGSTPVALVLLLGSVDLCRSATVDMSKLPPPAKSSMDFNRDVLPILEKSCLRCHGPERPKSEFRLDRRELALKGGSVGVDIVPGKSAESPLIHFVSFLVEDMEMPPPGKGERLSREQIGTLRAWVDQGAEWGTQTNQPRYTLAMSQMAGFTTVKGNEAKFREHYGRPQGANGGMEDFELMETLGSDSRLRIKARALRDEYRMSLSLEKNQVGSVTVGWEQFRKYYSDTGGYAPSLTPSTFTLDRDLHLDSGRAWVDFVLTPPRWPIFKVGYEYQYRDGTKALTSWGPVTDGVRTLNIFPAYKSLHESVHVLKLDVDYDLGGFRIQDQFRGEFYDLKSDRHHVTLADVTGPGITSRQDIQEGSRHFHGANTLRVEHQFKDWLFGSAGYLYSKLDGESAIGLVGTFWSYAATPIDGQLASQEIVIRRESHVANLNALLGPWQGFTVTAGAQSEWTRTSGFGRGVLNSAFIADQLETMSANSDRSLVEESLSVRYTKIPATVLFAEARLRQESANIYEDQTGGLGIGYDFLQDTAVTSEVKDWRAGFSSSPVSRVTFGGHYRHREYSDHFNPRRDEAFGFPNSGYPSFIRERETQTGEVEGRCVLRVTSWLKTTLVYKWSDADYFTSTDPELSVPGTPGGGHYSGKQDSHTYSFNTTLTPWRRLYLGSTVTYRHTRTTTEQNDVASIVPYRGDLYTLMANATYVLSETVDLNGTYTYSRADYGQENGLSGLPLGLDYELHGVQTGLTWHFRKKITTRLQYGFYTYDEKNTGGWNNYVAHSVFAIFSVKMP